MIAFVGHWDNALYSATNLYGAELEDSWPRTAINFPGVPHLLA